MIPSAIESALHPAGIQAARIDALWWVLFGVSAAVWIAVMIALALAIRRGRSQHPEEIPHSALVRGVSWASGVTIVILIGLLTASAVTGRAIASLRSDRPLALEIRGHRWWWEVRYLDDVPSQQVTTANELHLPVGRPVAITLKSADVIHSFWVPNLHGKMDAIPGRVNTTWLQVDRAGVFRGRCAEYCGLQHAHMAFTVVAEPADQFERWLAAQRQPAPEPATPEQVRGRDIVERGPCAMCHNIRGTTAGGRTGPDLTHFASRSTIAAGTAPNTRGYLAGWIADPQNLKPGALMPPTGLSAPDLQAVLAYLETLR